MTRLPIISATHTGNGIWKWHCELHNGPAAYVGEAVSSPAHAVVVAQQHADREHPGVYVRITTTSGSLHRTFYHRGGERPVTMPKRQRSTT